jgi:hypothetical protein
MEPVKPLVILEDIDAKIRVLRYPHKSKATGSGVAEHVRISDLEKEHSYRYQVEILDGSDFMGCPRWVAASITPDRFGDGLKVLEGWKTIASSLGVSVTTAKEYALRQPFPLPVRYDHARKPWVHDVIVRAWRSMHSRPVVDVPQPVEHRGRRRALKTAVLLNVKPSNRKSRSARARQIHQRS